MTTAEWYENPLDERIAGLAEFEPWPKLTRHFRQITVTEKIDGTNACVKFIPNFSQGIKAKPWTIVVQSRNRIIIPGKNDNAGFAGWAYDNADTLFEHLGYGRHYGEWFGRKIGRTYGIDYRGFVIFNVDLWSCVEGMDTRYIMPDGSFLGHVPVLYRGMNDQDEIMNAATRLRKNGSVMVPGYDKPEGIVIWHTVSRISTKFTFDNNDRGKWETL